LPFSQSKQIKNKQENQLSLPQSKAELNCLVKRKTKDLTKSTKESNNLNANGLNETMCVLFLLWGIVG
jgi:hypothetical protein